MHSNDQVPILILHVLEANIPQDTSVVDQDIDAAVVLDGGFDDLLAVRDAVVIGYSLTACGFDLIDNNICCLCLGV